MERDQHTDKELMAAFEIANGRSSVDFRAMRERIGWSQTEAATAIGVNPDALKKWESPLSGWEVRPYGWAWIDRMHKAHYEEVDRLIGVAIEEIAKRGIPSGGVVKLSYYRLGQGKATGARTRHGEPAGAASAVSRAVGEYLEGEGYVVRYVWAENGDWII